MSTTSGDFHEECVQQLMNLGFLRDQAEVALVRTDYDVNSAANMLLHGGVAGNDNEFDLIAADEANRPVAANKPHQVGKQSQTDGSHAPVTTDEADEFDDSRIASLKEMGFTTEEAKSALAQCGGDVNDALTLLLGSR